MPKEMRKFLFDQPYHGAVAFDSNDCVFIQDPTLSFQAIDPKISHFQQSTRSTNAIQVFKDLFEMSDYELLCRMDEDNIMKTLGFIKDNVEYNNLFCLATFSTHGEQYFANNKLIPEKQSRNMLGPAGRTREKNVTILTNYENICKKTIDEAASFFKYDLMQQNLASIPFTSIDVCTELNLEKDSAEKWICLDCKTIVKQQNGYFICNCAQKQCLAYQHSNLGTSISRNDEKIKASRELAKWTEAMKQKEPFVKPEKKAAYDHALECLKFMTKKHGSTLNTSELTTDIQQLTKEEFTDAIDNFVKTCENSGKLLQKCKEIVEVLESQ
uniref:Uncharacterized protein n=1 Tax=Panagrolaimus sp. JU765 TaxID=591449 RepID=A0AC34Q380_9BILA